MSVDHYLLPITDAELASLLEAPARVRDLVQQRSDRVVTLGEDGVAIVSLTATSDQDPLSFLRTGAPDSQSGWIGKYVEEGGRVITCEVDMGYGPASYYRNSFLIEVARKLQPLTRDAFARKCNLDWLEKNHVYPGGWHNEGMKEILIDSFDRYRTCVLGAAKSGRHLLVWCG